MKKIAFLFALLLNATCLLAQGQGEFLVELDPATGAMTKIGGPIPGVNWVYLNNRAYDQVNGRYIFQGGINSPESLNSINVLNGDIVTNPPFTDGHIMAPEFDNSTQTMYGIYYDNSVPAYYLETIDPVTGLYTPVATTPTPIPGLVGFNQTMNTCDENGQHYIFCYTDYVTYACTLYSVELANGSTVSNPEMALQPGDRMVQMCYNNANDTLYGLMYEGSSQLYFLIWIDIVTGDVFKIGTGTGLADMSAGATLDLANRRFIYSYYQYLNNQFSHYLTVLSLVDGSVVYHNQIGIDNLDNVHAVKYDNVLHRLFAIHWDYFISDPLQLHLLSFDAQRKGSATAAISWKVAEADGNEQFEVQHSVDGKSFSAIAALPARAGDEQYYTEHAMTEGDNFYRLRTTDVNGHATYSNVVHLHTLDMPVSLTLLPNVVTGSATLTVSSGGNAGADIVITDAGGKQVYKATRQLQKGINTIPLNLSGLATGSYTLHLQSGAEAQTALKFVKL